MRADMGHILENVVYLELLRRGYEVYIGKAGNAEIDFVAIGEEGEEYYQVALTVLEESILERELALWKVSATTIPSTCWLWIVRRWHPIMGSNSGMCWSGWGKNETDDLQKYKSAGKWPIQIRRRQIAEMNFQTRSKL